MNSNPFSLLEAISRASAAQQSADKMHRVMQGIVNEHKNNEDILKASAEVDTAIVASKEAYEAALKALYSGNTEEAFLAALEAERVIGGIIRTIGTAAFFNGISPDSIVSLKGYIDLVFGDGNTPPLQIIDSGAVPPMFPSDEDDSDDDELPHWLADELSMQDSTAYAGSDNPPLLFPTDEDTPPWNPFDDDAEDSEADDE